MSLRPLATLFALFVTPGLWADLLEPRLVADFRDGEPQLTIAPGEKRLGRSTLPGDPYGKHPYSAHGKRISLKNTTAMGEESVPYLLLRTNMAADVFGAFNLQVGALSGWFRMGKPPVKDQALLSARGGFMESYPGNARWELGLRAEGGFYITTPYVARCEAAIPATPEGEWVHIAAVWDRDAGARLYLNGKEEAAVWRPSAASESTAPLFDTAITPQAWKESTFSRGTGARGKVTFNNTKEWSDDRVEVHTFPEGEGLLIDKKTSERLQLRTRKLLSLPAGRYELRADVRQTDGADGWAPRLTIRSNGETRFLAHAQAVPDGSRALAFEIAPEEGDAEIALDLNLSAQGRYELRRLSVQHASEADATLVPASFPMAVERLFFHADAENPELAVRDLRVYDVALSEAGVHALFSGAPLQRDFVEHGVEPHTELRRASFGWERPPAEPLPMARTGEVLHFRQAPVLEARENRRAAGWLAVSGFRDEGFPWGYHGYSQGVARELHLELGFTPNWMTGSATGFDGFLGEQPFQASGACFGKAINANGPQLSFRHRSGALTALEFYHVSTGAATLPAGARAYPLWNSEETLLAPVNERERLSAYPPSDRQVLGGYQRRSHPLATLPLPGLQVCHFASPKVTADYALGGVALRLRTAPLSSSRRARFVVHDPSSPWRELARIECTLEPGQPNRPADYTILLDIRNTLLPSGTTAWVSMVFDEDVDLQVGNGGSELVVLPAEDAAQATALWREWELRSIRDRVERLSEPRPWGDVGANGESGWWLAVSTPVYEQISHGLQRLRARFPEDPVIAAYDAFVHPKAPSTIRDIPLPAHEGHPEWAVLARECLRQYKAFVDFWVDTRQLENGEFGHFYGDDTDLVQDWLDLSLISDPSGKYTASLGRLAHGIARTFKLTGGRDGPGPNGNRVAGEPILRNGLNVRWTDTLHAYEEGLNVQPPDFVAHYGDPVRFQRLLDTVARYDGFLLTPEVDGVRRFPHEKGGSGFVNTEYYSGSATDKYSHLMLHAGLVATWYNGSPAIWSMFEAVARGELEGGHAVPAAGASLLQAAFHKSGKVEYLAPFMDVALWKSRRVADASLITPNTIERLPGLDRVATLEHLSRDAQQRYASHPSTILGWSDNRHLSNWLEWKLSGNEEHLTSGLRDLYRDLVSLMPMRTVAEQSGDRVSPPKQLISQLYLGGIPGSRNRHFYPDFAVSYRGLSDNFAARVVENRPRNLAIELYSFEERPLSGEVRVWGLNPGEYRIIQKNMDGAESVSTRFLRRGDGFPVTLQPAMLQRVMVAQVSPCKEPPLLGDAALAVEHIERQEGRLVVPVYNLGVVPLADLTVTVRDKAGRALAEKPLARLPGVAGWKLGEARVAFDSPLEDAATIEVSGSEPEITTVNNRIEL